MPAKDLYHDAVRNALIKAGWIITHDPYTLTFGQREVFVDIGAERVIAAERGNEKIAVEIKSFRSPSEIRDLELAVGQYAFYRSLIVRFEPTRDLYLAVPNSIFTTTLTESIARPVLQDLAIRIFSFDPDLEEIVTWIP